MVACDDDIISVFGVQLTITNIVVYDPQGIWEGLQLCHRIIDDHVEPEAIGKGT